MLLTQLAVLCPRSVALYRLLKKKPGARPG
jgi:hypothetical protein